MPAWWLGWRWTWRPGASSSGRMGRRSVSIKISMVFNRFSIDFAGFYGALDGFYHIFGYVFIGFRWFSMDLEVGCHTHLPGAAAGLQPLPRDVREGQGGLLFRPLGGLSRPFSHGFGGFWGRFSMVSSGFLDVLHMFFTCFGHGEAPSSSSGLPRVTSCAGPRWWARVASTCRASAPRRPCFG